MSVVNLTPHPIRIYSQDTPDEISDLSEGLLHTIQPSGTVARIAVKRGHLSTVNVGGTVVQLQESAYGEPVGLPDPQPGVYYVISLALAVEVRHLGRTDLLTVDSMVRNMEGTFIGCRAFGRAVDTDPRDYDYEHYDPRNILEGKKWETQVDGTLIGVLPPFPNEEFGTVTIYAGRQLMHLHQEVAEALHQAIGYARHRAGFQQPSKPYPTCPECWNPGERIGEDGPMVRCINGHVWEPERTER